ncbi:MAG: ribbon-helix-helix protein, CopG family [Myxococcota bacterium]
MAGDDVEGHEALQARYVEVVGRPTGSTNASYLIWRVRQAEKGKIPVGPRAARTSDGETVEFKVLPLRMEAELVAKLDEARERLGLKSRMDLFRRALGVYLEGAGEVEVGKMFGAEG